MARASPPPVVGGGTGFCPAAEAGREAVVSGPARGRGVADFFDFHRRVLEDRLFRDRIPFGERELVRGCRVFTGRPPWSQ